MKRLLRLCFQSFLLCAFIGCTENPHALIDYSKQTVLNTEQVMQLWPFMYDLTKEGVVDESILQSTFSDGSIFEQKFRKQSYSFIIYVDEKEQPILIKDEESKVNARRAGSFRPGLVTVHCIGGCRPHSSPQTSCSIEGCEMVDDACGCTPLECPGCENAGCLPGASGALFGSVMVIR